MVLQGAAPWDGCRGGSGVSREPVERRCACRRPRHRGEVCTKSLMCTFEAITESPTGIRSRRAHIVTRDAVSMQTISRQVSAFS